MSISVAVCQPTTASLRSTRPEDDRRASPHPVETVRCVHAALLKAGFADLRPAHLAVFQHLEPGGTRQTALAERAQITNQSMGYLVDYLVRAGYVSRDRDPGDGRASLVRLTKRGEAVEQTARVALGRLEKEWESRLGAPRYTQFKIALAELTEATAESQSAAAVGQAGTHLAHSRSRP